MRALPDGAAEAIAAIVGGKGVVPESDWATFNVEWRRRWKGAPAMIVAPGSVEEASALVRACAQRRIAITPQGGNTGLVGGQIATNGEVLVTMRRMRKIRDASALDNTLVTEAGVTLAEAQDAATAIDRLFPLSIGSEGSCQIGGVISSNAGGVNVIRYGNARDLVLGLEAVLPSGEVWNGLKRLRKDNTGYDLKQLFIGGEGTLGLITAASLKLYPAPRERLAVFAGLASPDAALRLLSRAQGESGGAVTSFELMSRAILALVFKNIADTRDPLGAAHPWYALVEFSAGRPGALRPMAEEMLGAALDAGEISDAAIADNDAQAKAFWRLRHTMSEAMKPEGGQAKYDVSVPVASVPAFLDAADAAVRRACAGARIVAFGHMGDGNIHYDVLQPAGMARSDFDAREAAIEQAVYDAIDRFEGSISAEHGVGLSRRDDIARRKSPAELTMMRTIKAALDPDGIMNPGKMV
ncbi:MAG: FAD-binding oxidoreductase [Parvularculaceae bacterium]